MSIDDYFVLNCISPKSRGDASEEHANVNDISDYSVFWDSYFKSGLEEFIDCVDYDINMVLFSLLKEKVSVYSDLVEPCCQSGILGCYLASELRDSRYFGFDKNPIAVQKAKARSEKNGLSQDIFIEIDKAEYYCKHEAVVGRFIANRLRFKPHYNIDDDAMDFLSRASENVILIQPSQVGWLKETVREYDQAFKRHGYRSFRVDSLSFSSPATGSVYFLMEAHK